MLGIEERVVGGIDEELAAVRVRTGVRHRYRARDVVIIDADLVRELISGTACSPQTCLAVILGQRIAALIHESGDYAVEFGTVIEAGLCKLHEIGDGVRRSGIEGDGDVAKARMKGR